MSVAVLIQLIVRPENHEEVIGSLFEIADNTRYYQNNLGFHIHYLSSNPGAFYILSKWHEEIDMNLYLDDFNSDNLIKNLSIYLISHPTISRAKMLSQPSNKPSNQNNSQITLIPFFYIIPQSEEIEKVKRAHLSVISFTRNEPGSITYDLYQLLDDPAIMFFYENWSSTEALSKHMNTRNFYQVVRNQVDPYLLVPWTSLSMKIVRD